VTSSSLKCYHARPEPIKRIHKTLLWLAFVALVCIFVVVRSPLAIRSHLETSELLADFSDLANCLVGHNYEQAYQMGGSDFREALSYEQFVADQKSLEEKYGGIKTIARQTYDVKGSGTPMFWRGDIEADFVYERETIRVEIVFHQENGRWVIFGMKQL